MYIVLFCLSIPSLVSFYKLNALSYLLKLSLLVGILLVGTCSNNILNHQSFFYLIQIFFHIF